MRPTLIVPSHLLLHTQAMKDPQRDRYAKAMQRVVHSTSEDLGRKVSSGAGGSSFPAAAAAAAAGASAQGGGARSTRKATLKAKAAVRTVTRAGTAQKQKMGGWLG